VGGGRHHGAHGHQRVKAGVGERAGKPAVAELAEESPRRRAQKQRGRKDPAGAAGADGDAGGENLHAQQHAQHEQRKLAVQRVGNGAVAHAENVRKGNAHAAHQAAAQRGLGPFRQGHAHKCIFAAIEHAHKGAAHQPGQHPHRHEREQLQRAAHFVFGNGKGRLIAQQPARGHRGHHRRNNDGRKLGDGEIADNHLHRKQRARNGRVEGGGNARRRAAAHNGAQPAAPAPAATAQWPSQWPSQFARWGLRAPPSRRCPMQSAEASVLTSAMRGRITPPRSATASITSGTPCPRASRAKNHTSGPTISPPNAGIKISSAGGEMCCATARGSLASASNPSSNTAATPAGPSKKKRLRKANEQPEYHRAQRSRQPAGNGHHHREQMPAPPPPQYLAQLLFQETRFMENSKTSVCEPSRMMCSGSSKGLSI